MRKEVALGENTGFVAPTVIVTATDQDLTMTATLNELAAVLALQALDSLLQERRDIIAERRGSLKAIALRIRTARAEFRRAAFAAGVTVTL